MSSAYEVGSLCEDCMHNGLQNHLKHFYINLDEQIIKCESSSCMFPYLRKPVISDISNYSRPIENATTFLDEFIEQSWKEIDDAPAKSSIQKCTTKEELVTADKYDFSAIFMDQSIKTEVKQKPLMFDIVKQEPNVQASAVLEPNKVMKNIKGSKTNTEINSKKKMIPPQKTRISRCLSGVKSTSKPSNAKKPIKKETSREKNEPVLVIEPQSGKSMRPLDLIKRYMKNK